MPRKNFISDSDDDEPMQTEPASAEGECEEKSPDSPAASEKSNESVPDHGLGDLGVVEERVNGIVGQLSELQDEQDDGDCLDDDMMNQFGFGDMEDEDMTYAEARAAKKRATRPKKLKKRKRKVRRAEGDEDGDGDYFENDDFDGEPRPKRQRRPRAPREPREPGKGAQRKTEVFRQQMQRHKRVQHAGTVDTEKLKASKRKALGALFGKLRNTSKDLDEKKRSQQEEAKRKRMERKAKEAQKKKAAALARRVGTLKRFDSIQVAAPKSRVMSSLQVGVKYVETKLQKRKRLEKSMSNIQLRKQHKVGLDSRNQDRRKKLLRRQKREKAQKMAMQRQQSEAMAADAARAATDEAEPANAEELPDTVPLEEETEVAWDDEEGLVGAPAAAEPAEPAEPVAPREPQPERADAAESVPEPPAADKPAARAEADEPVELPATVPLEDGYEDNEAAGEDIDLDADLDQMQTDASPELTDEERARLLLATDGAPRQRCRFIQDEAEDEDDAEEEEAVRPMDDFERKHGFAKDLLADKNFEETADDASARQRVRNEQQDAEDEAMLDGVKSLLQRRNNIMDGEDVEALPVSSEESRKWKQLAQLVDGRTLYKKDLYRGGDVAAGKREEVWKIKLMRQKRISESEKRGGGGGQISDDDCEITQEELEARLRRGKEKGNQIGGRGRSSFLESSGMKSLLGLAQAGKRGSLIRQSSQLGGRLVRNGSFLQGNLHNRLRRQMGGSKPKDMAERSKTLEEKGLGAAGLKSWCRDAGKRKVAQKAAKKKAQEMALKARELAKNQDRPPLKEVAPKDRQKSSLFSTLNRRAMKGDDTNISG